MELMPTDAGMTQQELTQKYPTKTDAGNILESFLTGLSLLLYNFNQSINRILTQIGISEGLLGVVKIIAVILILILVLVLRVVIKKARLKRKQNEVIY
jgi:tetrahydromethanopterin S-methyltransferase subunit E